MPTTSLKSLCALAGVLTQAGLSQAAGSGASIGDSSTPWGISAKVLDDAFASPNATGVYPGVYGADIMAAPAFADARWNLSISIKEGIPVNSANISSVNVNKVVTGTRVYFAPPNIGSLNLPTPKANDTTSVSLCLIYGYADKDIPTAGGSAEDSTGKCDAALDECKKDLNNEMLLSKLNSTGCRQYSGLPKSCQDKLGWKVSASTGTNRVAMNQSALLNGGILMQYTSDFHDAGNLTDYKEAVSTTWGTFFYFVFHEYNNVTGNRTRSQGATFPGFMCAKASNITAGSVSGANALGGGLSVAGVLAMVFATMVVL